MSEEEETKYRLRVRSKVLRVKKRVFLFIKMKLKEQGITYLAYYHDFNPSIIHDVRDLITTHMKNMYDGENPHQ